MEFTIIIGAVIIYLIFMIILHKIFEKFFMMLFIILSALFFLGVFYFALKGG